MTDPVNIPDGILSSDFPAPADRTAGVFNSKALAWANSARDMSERDREIAQASRTNAVSSRESAVAADLSRQQAQQARNDAQTAAEDAGDSAAVVGRWDKLVLGPKSTPPTTDNDGQPLLEGAEYYNTTTKARYSWTGAAWMIGTNVIAGVSSINGKTGVVNLGIGDVVNPGDIVAYGPTKPAARAAIDAGYNYERGTQTLTTSQTINRSMFGTAMWVRIELRGGGASGGASVGTNLGRGGGEGGEYASFVVRVADLPASIPVVVGAGGAAVTATATGTAVGLFGNDGGDTTFNGTLRAYGGVASTAAASSGIGSAKQWLAGKNGGEGGGIAASTPNSNSRMVTGAGGPSVHGGGGGGGSFSTYQAAGISQTAGSGGAGKTAAGTGESAAGGAIPSGGGGAIHLNVNTGTATSGAGGRGEIKLTWW